MGNLENPSSAHIPFPLACPNPSTKQLSKQNSVTLNFLNVLNYTWGKRTDGGKSLDARRKDEERERWGVVCPLVVSNMSGIPGVDREGSVDLFIYEL